MFSRSKDEITTTPPAKAPTEPVSRPLRQSRPASNAPSIIGSDVHIVGNISTAGEIQLDGSVEGDVQAGSLTMGEQGMLKGTLSADSVVVRGHIDGAIRARTVVLERSAKISGDVYHETLSIEAGAIIDGKFSHSPNPAEQQAKKQDSKPSASGSGGAVSGGKPSPEMTVVKNNAASAGN